MHGYGGRRPTSNGGLLFCSIVGRVQAARADEFGVGFLEQENTVVNTRRLLSAVLISGALAIVSGSSLNANPDVPPQEADRPAGPAPEGTVPIRLTAPAGTPVRVRLNNALRTGLTRPGDRFTVRRDKGLGKNQRFGFFNKKHVCLNPSTKRRRSDVVDG